MVKKTVKKRVTTVHKKSVSKKKLSKGTLTKRKSATKTKGLRKKPYSSTKRRGSGPVVALERRVERVERFARGVVSDEAAFQSSRIEAVMKIIIFLGILGFLVSSYLLWLHYSNAATTFCSINEKFNCATVAKSGYSEMLGVPVALIGMLGYLAFVVISCFLIYRDVSHYPTLNVKLLNRIMLAMAVGGFLFSVYLSFVQHAIIGVWCIMCIVSATLITIILLLAIISQSYCIRCRQKLIKMGVEPVKVCRYC